ncbi:hypothetical protein [Streptomyces microflavus]|uniref:Nucleoside 2-deoxyribosyltransferase n=1 Tax=Streptomyces microflavus TaxID=1919 RepID=A0ABV1PV73_STRMI
MDRYIYSIMPVSSDVDYSKKRVCLDRVAAEFGLSVHFPLDRGLPAAGQEFDLRAVVTTIGEAAAVIADLSLERPSCYYELGLAQAIGGRVSLIARAGTTIHQAFGRNAVSYFQDLQDYPAVVRRMLANA